ncbi:hypothetical protein BDI4_120208 [Burkholderia diffusa]|nr:hypothetical protein BDI4_120208 [Burkholderia diffusa]
MLGRPLDRAGPMGDAQFAPQRRTQRPHDDACVRQRRARLVRQQRRAVARGDQTLDRIVVVEFDARLGAVATEREPFRREPRQAGGRIVENQRTRCQIGRRHTRRQPPVRRQKGQHRIAPPRADRQPRDRRLRQRHQADVERALRDARQCVVRREYRDLDIDVRMPLAQPGHRLRQQMSDRAGRCAETHPPGQPLHLSLHIVEGRLDLGQQTARPLHQHGTDGRRLHVAARARQQRRTDAAFEFGNMKADRRRREMKQLRGGHEGSLVGDRDQRTQSIQTDLAHFHLSFRKSESRNQEIQLFLF